MLVGAGVVGAGCRGVEKPADQTSVQLKWFHQANTAGLYAADQKGFYAEENIGVTLNAGGPDIPFDRVIGDLLSGETTFAIVNPDQIFIARAEGVPVVAIAVIFQKNPLVYVSLKSSGIKRPQDFVGRKVMLADTAKFQHQALMNKLGIDPATIEIIPWKQDLTPLVTGQVDLHLVYRTSLAISFEEAGHELNIIWLDDYGVHLYADTIIATEQLVRENPDLVERFLRATLRGWRYAIENRADTVDMILQYDTTLDRDHQLRMMAAQTHLIHTGEEKIGWMEDRVWQEMHQMLLDGGILPQSIDVAEAYTMQFLNTIYGEAR